jgi:hypothetical protein
MRWPVIADDQLAAAGEAVFGAVAAGVVAYLGFMLQQGGRQARLRRSLAARLELRSALEDLDAPRAAESRNLIDHEVEHLLAAYAPTREETYSREIRAAVAALALIVLAVIGSLIFLASNEWLVGGLFGLAISALVSLQTTLSFRAAYRRRSENEQSNDPDADR